MYACVEGLRGDAAPLCLWAKKKAWRERESEDLRENTLECELNACRIGQGVGGGAEPKPHIIILNIRKSPESQEMTAAKTWEEKLSRMAHISNEK